MVAMKDACCYNIFRRGFARICEAMLLLEVNCEQEVMGKARDAICSVWGVAQGNRGVWRPAAAPEHGQETSGCDPEAQRPCVGRKARERRHETAYSDPHSVMAALCRVKLLE